MMKSLFTFTLLAVILFGACNPGTESNDAASVPTQTTHSTSPEETVSAASGKVLLQTAKVESIQFSQNGDVLLCTYQAGDNDVANIKNEEGGLTAFENHIANMLSLTSVKCAVAKTPIKMIAYVFLEKDKRFLGRFDLPCNFARTVYSNIGPGATTEYSTKVGGNTENIATNQLNITEANLESFQKIVKGLQPQEHNGFKVGDTYSK